MCVGCWMLDVCWVVDVGCSMLGVGWWMLDVGCWMLGVGCWVLDVGCWMLGVGCWMLDVGCWMLDVRCWMLDVGCSMFSTITKWASFVKLSHTVFALPFALASMVVAARAQRGWPGW